jgi:hypothetical protein
MSAETTRSAGVVRQACDECGERAPIARYCAYNETMTHRRVLWLCGGCHPRG